MNYEIGFRPVPFSALTDDPEFWKGCQGCRNWPILEANNFKMCLCTGLLYDPAEHIQVLDPAIPDLAEKAATQAEAGNAYTTQKQ